jgi:hypothetical protein
VELRARISFFIEHHNPNPTPFRWTKSGDDIFSSIERFCAYNLRVRPEMPCTSGSGNQGGNSIRGAVAEPPGAPCSWLATEPKTSFYVHPFMAASADGLPARREAGILRSTDNDCKRSRV